MFKIIILKIGIDAKRAFTNYSGLGNYSRDIINSLSNFKNLDLHLFTTKKNILNYKKPESSKIHIPQNYLSKNYWRLYGLNKIIQKENLQIFHGLSNEIPFGLNEKIKSVVTIHDVIFKKYPQFYNSFDRFIYSLKTYYSCKKSNKIITVSKQTKEDLIKYFKINPEKIEVIYQSCHIAFKTPLKDINISNKYKLPKDYILFVGTIEKRKNLKFLLNAIKDSPSINLVCIGEKKSYYRHILNFINNEKINNKIFFLEVKSVNDLSDIYKKAKFLVYPSYYEGFGIPIIEALFSEIPVITLDKPVFRETGGNYCSYVKNSLELKKLIAKFWEMKTIQNKNSKNWIKKYNSSKQADQIIRIYNEIIK